MGKIFVPPVPAVKPVRAQLNVEVGLSRLDRLREFCKKRGISQAKCVKAMLDFCLREERG